MKIPRLLASLVLIGLLIPLASISQITNNHFFLAAESPVTSVTDPLMNQDGLSGDAFLKDGDPLIATREDTWSNNAWSNNDSLEYYYDENNLLIERLQRKYENNQWIYSSRVVYEYDANFNRIYELRQNIVPDGYVNVLQYTSEYDANNNRTVHVLQFWFGSSWSNVGSKDLYEYDASNNLTYHLLQNWVYGTWGYADVNATTYEYDANNNVSWAQKEEWVDPFGSPQWIPTKQYFYDYDANNNLVHQTWQSWNSDLDVWSTYYTRAYEYDGNNNVIYHLDTLGSAISQAFFEYDLNNSVINLIIQDFDNPTGSWVNDVQGIWEYDANGNNILAMQQTGNPYNSNWTNQYKDSWEYDAGNNKSLHVFQFWDFGEEVWVNSTRMLYYYGLMSGFSDLVASGPAITIYPNPNNGIFTIGPGKDELQAGTVNVYNAHGQLVYSQTMTGGEYDKSLNLTGVPQGTYFVQLWIGDKFTTQPFIIAF